MSAELDQLYRAYLGALNERRFGDLGQFVHDEVVRNDQAMTSQPDNVAGILRIEAAQP